jgi:hypothetical protein
MEIFFLLETLGPRPFTRFFETGAYLPKIFEPITTRQNDQMLMKNDQIQPIFSEKQLVINPVISGFILIFFWEKESFAGALHIGGGEIGTLPGGFPFPLSPLFLCKRYSPFQLHSNGSF